MRFLLVAFLLAQNAFAQAPEVPDTPDAPEPSSSRGDEVYAWPPEPPFDVIALERDLGVLKAQVSARKAPLDARNEALLRLKIEQVELCLDILQGRYTGRTLYNKGAVGRVAPLFFARATEVATAKGDAASDSLLALHERAYIAPNDGSTQPYWVFVPRDYSPDKKYGLAIFLHGYGPDISKINPWLPDESAVGAAHKANMLLVVPHGRRNTDFVDVGEDDVLQVLAETQKHYSIDPERTLLTGPSMGGFGTWAIGLHRPDLWAGIAPMAARTDFYLWFKLDRNAVPAWKRIGYDADNPRTLAANGSNLPMFFQHGALDAIVNVEQSRRMARDLQTLKIAHFYREIPLGDHYIYFYNGAYDAAFSWATPLKRPAVPARVRYISGNARNAGAYWARIEDRADYSIPASIDVSIEPAKTRGAPKYLVRAATRNVLAFSLSPPPTLLPGKAAFNLEVNGKTTSATRGANNTISWRAASTPVETAWPERKTPERCGPIKNAWRDPFLVVYGTQVLERGVKNPDEARARAWAAQWHDYSDGTPRIKSDREVTPEDRRNFNLVLFGDARSNSLLAEPAAKFPLRWSSEGVRVGEGKGVRFFRHSVPGARDEVAAPPASAPAQGSTPTQTTQREAPAPGVQAPAAQAPGGAVAGAGAPGFVPLDPDALKSGEVAAPRETELGLAFVYASPWSSERVVVVQSGPLWGGFLPWNHRWDLLPDWAVFAPRRDPSDNTNQTLAAGFFGRKWQIMP